MSARCSAVTGRGSLTVEAGGHDGVLSMSFIRPVRGGKTERSRRTLALAPIVVSGLREQRQRQLAERLAAGSRWLDEGFVFTTPTGGPLNAWHVTRSFQRALAAAGLARQPFHSLRHAYATLLLEQGEELGVVSRILGHSNIATTSGVYAHFTRSLSTRAADRMDAVLSPRGTARGG
jgi:integrase